MLARPLAVLALASGLATAQSPGEVLEWRKLSATEGGGLPLASSDQFGRGADMIGDLDGDGIADLAVGALGDDEGGASTEANYGAVYILFLEADGSIRSRARISSTTPGFAGRLDEGDEFGRIVAGVGDMNGDGIPDLAVGSAKDDDGGSNYGAFYLLFLDRDGSLLDHRKYSATEGGFRGTLEKNDEFGRAIRRIPDLDDDGFDDLVVGASGTSNALWVLFMNPDLTVKDQVEITSSSPNFTAPNANDFAFDFALLGDLDGDGNVEIAAGVPDYAPNGWSREEITPGAVFVLFLNDDGTLKDMTVITEGSGGFTGDLTTTWNPEFGAALREIGDVDGDGMVDLAVGAAKDDDGPNANAVNRGAVWILLMNTDGTVKAHQKISLLEGGFDAPLQNRDRFGTAIAAPGDVNGDGVCDVWVGARFDDDGGPNAGAMYLLLLNDGTIVPEFESELERIGCGSNTPGSLAVLAGAPQLATTMSFGIDNPLGTQTAGSGTLLFVSYTAQPMFPCGRPIAGMGMEAGEPGELLFNPQRLFNRAVGPRWDGPGQPAVVDFVIPNNADLLGLELFVQALIQDRTGPVGSALTEGYRLVIGR